MSLCSVADYRTFTGDTTSDDADIPGWITLATGMVEGYLGRPLESEERTETLRIFATCGYVGWVYPAATPVTAVDASGAADPSTRARIYVSNPTYNTSLPWMPYPYVDVTYTGGYTDETVPGLIKRAIAVVAHSIGTVDPASPNADAQDVQIGDIKVGSIGESAGSLDALAPGVSATIQSYRVIPIA